MASGESNVLEDLGGGLFAYLQLPGSWGLSNSGLITSGDEALLVDTLYDRPRTEAMLRTYRDAAPAASGIGRVVNTHANGDHCYGNGCLPGASFIASDACADEMALLPPRTMARFMALSRTLCAMGPVRSWGRSLFGAVGLKTARAFFEAAPFVRDAFDAFDFASSELVLPTETFSGVRTETVGDHHVDLVEVGPAHTRGDVLVYVPARRVVFTGDILFNQAHPVMWEGPVENWIAAFDHILEADVEVVVPGHGPLADKAAVRRAQSYFVALRDAARTRFDAGVNAHDAALDIALDDFSDWREAERIFPNVMTLYRGFARDASIPHMAHLFAGMQTRREAA